MCTPGHAEAAAAQRERAARLARDRHRDRPLVVLHEEHLRRLVARGEDERLVRVALRGGAVAVVHEHRGIRLGVAGADQRRRTGCPWRSRSRAASATRARACRGGSCRSRPGSSRRGSRRAAATRIATGSRPRIMPTMCSRYDGKRWSCGRAACAEPTCAASWPWLGTHRASWPCRCRFAPARSSRRDDRHVAVELLEHAVGERLDEGEVGLRLGCRTQLALGGQQLDRRRGELSLAGCHRSTLPATPGALLVKPVQAHPESGGGFRQTPLRRSRCGCPRAGTPASRGPRRTGARRRPSCRRPWAARRSCRARRAPASPAR